MTFFPDLSSDFKVSPEGLCVKPVCVGVDQYSFCSGDRGAPVCLHKCVWLKNKNKKVLWNLHNVVTKTQVCMCDTN